jgi:putative ABC transport system permease protein
LGGPWRPPKPGGWSGYYLMRAPLDYYHAGPDAMAQSNCRDEDRSARVFRALLGLYPTAFRDEYDRELTLVFIDRYRDAAGSWDRARLWLDVLRGIASEAPKEHYRMILQDLRYAWRGLRHHWVVTITIVFMLGLGIGANTAMFSLLNAVVLRTLPVPDADQLFMVTSTVQEGNRFSGPMFERLHKGAPAGVEVAAISRVVRVYTRTEGIQETEPAALQLVSSNYFQLLRASPVLGTPLAREGENSPVAVVSYRYWQRRLAKAPDVLGSALTIGVASDSY